ncbi:MAG: hypothetical protein WD534_17825 [Phycisphaeraceae bacterium]
MNFRFDQPELLWLLLLALPIIWLGKRSLASLEPARRWTAVALRLSVLLVLVLMLAGFQLERRHSDLTVMAVIDQSESVRRFAQPPPPDPADLVGPNAPLQRSVEQWQQQWLRQAASDRRQDDRFGMVTYDGRPTVRAMPGELANFDPGTIDDPVEGTDAAAALRTAMALFPPDTGQRMLWVSDGNDGLTDASGRVDASAVLDVAYEARAAGIAIDVMPMSYRVDREVMVDGIYSPTEVREGQTVALRVVLRATHPARGTLHILHDEEPIDLTADGDRSGVPITPDDWTLESDDTPAEAASAAGPPPQKTPPPWPLPRPGPTPKTPPEPPDPPPPPAATSPSPRSSSPSPTPASTASRPCSNPPPTMTRSPPTTAPKPSPSSPAKAGSCSSTTSAATAAPSSPAP